MWYLIILFCVIKPCVNGYTVIDNNVIEDCCGKGTDYAQTHSLEDCSLLDLANNKSYHDTRCLERMNQCCKDFHINKFEVNSSTPLTINIQIINNNMDLLTLLNHLLKNSSNLVNPPEQPQINTKFNCPVGYVLQGNQCVDLDECALIGSVSPCSQLGECINTVGSYQCRCYEGYANPPLINTECIVNRTTCSTAGSPCQHICTDTQNGFRCSCVSGFQLNSDNRTCSFVDECTQNVCQYQCRSYPGEQRCVCPTGYALASDGRSCTDINECSIGAETYCPIEKHIRCFNNYGSHRCIDANCPANYTWCETSRRRDYNNPWYGCIKICTSGEECDRLSTLVWHDYINCPSNQSSVLKKPFRVLLKTHQAPRKHCSVDINVIDFSVNVEKYRNHISVVRDDEWYRIYLVKRIEGPRDITFQVIIKDSATTIDSTLYLHLVVSQYTFY